MARTSAKGWIPQYLQDRASEAVALKRARQSGLGEYYTYAGVEMIAWPNGETSEASEYDNWLAKRAIDAQYGTHG